MDTKNVIATSKATLNIKSTSLARSSPAPVNTVNHTPPHSSRENLTCSTNSTHILSTPKRNIPDGDMSQTVRKKLLTPGGVFELQSLRLDSRMDSAVNIVKDRYVICAKPRTLTSSAFAKAPSCYRHLVDMNISNLRCTDVFSGEQFPCRVINETFDKVQQAYFRLQLDSDECRSSIYGHCLFREIKDIVPLNKDRTYVILAQPKRKLANINGSPSGIFEDLHTYLRKKQRLCENEARSLFHQICETVLFCHRNGVILRDLKLKRFFFVDEARTMLQYESLEGSMILENPDNDILSEKIGCPLYTAPELLCPEPTYKGKPADMWALGVILYTMLVGQYPFFEKGNSNLITIIRQCFVQLPGHLSRSARWLLLALLRKNISDRVPIEHIFLSPWLKEQRPSYMNIPVDVIVPDDEDIADISSESMDISDDDGIQPLDYTCSALRLNCSDSYSEMG